MEPQRAWFRFYAELNDHLAPDQQYRTLEKAFFVSGSVKDMIESFGVPHAEVELILIDGESADFSHLIHNGNRIAVYPIFESFDVTSELRVRPEPLRDPRFVLDVHLGKLAGYLRMLGFDAAYTNSATDPELVRTAAAEQRILLTRDRGLLMHGSVTRGYWLRETDSRRQAAEIVRRFDLARLVRPFTRCMACNMILTRAELADVRTLLPARVTQWYNRFLQCPGCLRIYWQGSHYRRMKAWIGELAGLQPTG